jgi:hypothetical protein
MIRSPVYSCLALGDAQKGIDWAAPQAAAWRQEETKTGRRQGSPKIHDSTTATMALKKRRMLPKPSFTLWPGKGEGQKVNPA